MSCALLGTLELAFAADMPVASVEIVDAEMRTVGSVLMRSDGRRVVELSGSPSFIRIHMPDARLITLPVSGRQELLVSRDMVAPGFERRRALARAVNEFQISRLPRDPRIPNEEISAAVWEGRNVQHPPASAWDWRLDGGKRGRDELNWIFTGVSQRPFNLVGTLGQSSIRVRIPGNVRKLKIESSATLPPSAVKIQLNSRTQVLDALAGYLQSTDMIGTTYAINDLLKSGAPRIADPFAGCLLAYLLLRLRRFDEPALEVFRAAEKSQTPDAAVIGAWLLLARTPERATEIAERLEQALNRGTPVYTEGTRLLIDGLLALGGKRLDRLVSLRKELGHVAWNAPVTTLQFQGDSQIPLPTLSVAFQA